jgi:hypothetical protein
VFDDGASLYLAWTKDTPLPAILTQSEDRKEGPVNYRMSGEYIVITPIPANLVLRYGSKYAVLWPTRYIPAPRSPATRMATAPAVPVQQPEISQAAPAQAAPQQPTPSSGSSLRLANVTSLYSDKLTDAGNDH